MKLLLIALFLAGCGIPFEEKHARPQRHIAGQANYPDAPIEVPAEKIGPLAEPVETLFECAIAADCSAIACAPPCAEWHCEELRCVLGSRRGRMCILGVGRAETVGVCDELGECKEKKK